MDIIIFILEIIGTIAFALSGAITGIKKRVDLFGVIFLGITTAVGGGILRDIIIGKTPPNAFVNSIYIIISVISSLIIFMYVFIRKEQFLSKNIKIDHIINVFDAVGLGIFTVNGMNTLLYRGEYSPLLVIFVGLCTGIGGGILRDTLINDIPFVLRKHVYAVASLLGAILYYCMFVIFSINQLTSMAMGGITIVCIRLYATKYKWSLPKIVLDE